MGKDTRTLSIDERVDIWCIPYKYMQINELPLPDYMDKPIKELGVGSFSTIAQVCFFTNQTSGIIFEK